MLSKTAATRIGRRPADRGDQLLQRPVHAARRQERHGHRGLFIDQRIADSCSTAAPRQHEFSRRPGHRRDQHHGVGDVDLGQHPAAGRARARQYRIDGELQQDDGAEDRVAKSSHAAQERGRERRRRLRFDHPVQQGRQRRHQQRQRVLAALGFVGGRERNVQQYRLHDAKQLHCRTARSGRPRTTAPGTAASPTATRISTPPTTRRSPAARCIRPNSIPPARCR